MPYIQPVDYVRASAEPKVPGELNYALTLRAVAYFQGVTDIDHFKEGATALVDQYMDRVGVSYTNYNAVVGVLACCGFELIRRMKNTQNPIISRIGAQEYNSVAHGLAAASRAWISTLCSISMFASPSYWGGA